MPLPGPKVWRFLPFLLVAWACGPVFDRTVWDQGRGNYGDRNPRLNMVSAAEEAGLVEGRARADVLALLGEPDATRPGRDQWYLGRSDLSPDYQRLVVTYDAGGQVAEVAVRTD